MNHCVLFINLGQALDGKKVWYPGFFLGGHNWVLQAQVLDGYLMEKSACEIKTSGHSTPVFTSEEVYGKAINLQDKVSTINRIPKPKPKIEKPVKNETESTGENGKSSSTTSEESSSQNDQSSGDSAGSTGDKVDSESKVHDEL